MDYQTFIKTLDFNGLIAFLSLLFTLFVYLRFDKKLKKQKRQIHEQELIINEQKKQINEQIIQINDLEIAQKEIQTIQLNKERKADLVLSFVHDYAYDEQHHYQLYIDNRGTVPASNVVLYSTIFHENMYGHRDPHASDDIQIAPPILPGEVLRVRGFYNGHERDFEVEIHWDDETQKERIVTQKLFAMHHQEYYLALKRLYKDKLGF